MLHHRSWRGNDLAFLALAGIALAALLLFFFAAPETESDDVETATDATDKVESDAADAVCPA